MNRPLLRIGSSGPPVTLLQNALNYTQASSSQLEIDGVFGPLTLAAVRAYQQLQRLIPDGIVGPNTHLSLEDAYQQLAKLVDDYVVPPADEQAARQRIVAIAQAQLASFGWIDSQTPPLSFSPRIAIRYMTDEVTRARQGGGPLSLIFATVGQPAAKCLKIPPGVAHGEMSEAEYSQQRNARDLENWCGLFALFVWKSAGLKVSSWQSKPFLPFKNQVVVVAPKNIKPGDIGIVEPHGGRNHHFIVTAVEGNMVHSIDGNAGLYHSILQRKYELQTPQQSIADKTTVRAIPGVFGAETAYFVAPRFANVL